MIGDVVNLAARLMQAARNDILCDAVTAQAARTRFQFEGLPSLILKGKAEAISVQRPVAQTGRQRLRTAPATPLVGREPERRVLLAALNRLTETGQGERVIIEGEAGIGKSRLITDLITLAQVQNLPLFIGGGEAVEKSTPYFVWRDVFEQLLGLDGLLADGAAYLRAQI